MPNVLIVGGGSGGYSQMFRAAGWGLALDPFDADMLQFTGGEDVTPAIYGEETHHTTGNYFGRDLQEAGYFAIAVRTGKPVSGICRGGQFLNVMSGGKMYQHVSKHAVVGTHKLVDEQSGNDIAVSSTHHQMMRAGPDGIIVATADLGGFKQYMADGTVVEAPAGEPDTEVVYYPHTKALCFQPHPEFFRPDHECFQYYFELINRYHGLKA
jgi:gamma-glutamyl-gamma-aminobutyrate hydrolase PuuD